MESEVLRDQLKKQESQLKIAKQREIELQQKLDEVQKERDRLLNKESDGGNWFAKRVVDLEREASEWNAEKQSVDARISQLMDIVSAALEDKPRRERKHVSPRSWSDPRTLMTSYDASRNGQEWEGKWKIHIDSWCCTGVLFGQFEGVRFEHVWRIFLHFCLFIFVVDALERVDGQL